MTTAGTAKEWDAVARDVVAGDYVVADSSTVEAVRIGLRATGGDLCERALNILDDKELEKKRVHAPAADLPKQDRPAADRPLPKRKASPQGGLF